jgi:P27 family predicted phage terminase small subunit
MTTPKDLGRDGRALWKRITDALDEQGLVFDELELVRLHGACQVADRLADVRASIRENGLMVEDPRKGPVPNSMLIREESLQKTLAGLLAKLKLEEPTPSTRTLNRRQRNLLRDATRRAG